MRVLIIYAHHNSHSFCHALLRRFTDGLLDAGHTSEIVDLHAIRFDPVLRDRDAPSWIDDSVPDDVLQHMNVKDSLIKQARNPLRRWLVKRWIGDLDARDIVRKIRGVGCPPDVAEQQAKVSRRMQSPLLHRSILWVARDTEGLARTRIHPRVRLWPEP